MDDTVTVKQLKAFLEGLDENLIIEVSYDGGCARGDLALEYAEVRGSVLLLSID